MACNLKTTNLLDCAFIGVCAVIGMDVVGFGAKMTKNILNPCHAELIKMLCPFPIFSQSDYLIQLLIQIPILNVKQCRSISVGF